MDFDYAHFALTEGRKVEEEAVCSSPSKLAYRKQLAETMNLNRNRILAFRNKPCPPRPLLPSAHSASLPQQFKPFKPRRHIPLVPERKLDAPDIVDDFYLNLLDWGSANVLAIALGSSVFLWDASASSVSELVTVDEEKGPVTSVNWAPDGRRVAVGLDNAQVQIWDSEANRLLRSFSGCHHSRVGSLAWNNNILTTGGMDGKIVNNDVRVSSHVVGTYKGHSQEVCGLKWSGSGQQLASGGNDNLVHIWDRCMGSSRHWMHRLRDHTSAVKALAWCPFQSNLLATGGGGEDRKIKFWNTHTGACLNSVDNGSQVSCLLWSHKERELLSSHGLMQNQLTLWKYPSMVKMAELTGHTSRVLCMAQSPNGCTVASAGGDERLMFWNVFGTPETATQKFTKILIELMEKAGWDLDLAANSVHREIDYAKKGHNRYALLSYVCLGMFRGFDGQGFDLNESDREGSEMCCSDSSLRELMQHVSSDPMELLDRDKDCGFSRFCDNKYHELIHPNMESSMFSNMDQNEAVLSSWRSLSTFYESFVTMASSIWTLHKLALSFDPPVEIFQVESGVDFSIVFMENVVRRRQDKKLAVSPARAKVGFTVVPGFKAGCIVIQSQVYLTRFKNVNERD